MKSKEYPILKEKKSDDKSELLDAIASVESSNIPTAVNPRTGARGMYQFMPIAWRDVVENYPMSLGKYADYERYSFDPEVSRKFAEALLELNKKRLEKKNIYNLENLLASYNQGIGAVLGGRPFPRETKQYIKKIKERLHNF